MQALITTLMVLVGMQLEGQPAPPTYGEAIVVMAAEAARLGDPQLTALVSDLCLRSLEGGEWARSAGSETLRALGGRLRNRSRASGRSRLAATLKKRQQRARLKQRHMGAVDELSPALTAPVAHEVLQAQPEAMTDPGVRRLEARQELQQLGFDALSEPSRLCLLVTEVMGLRYAAAADLLGMDSADQVRKLRARALARLRRQTTAR